MSELCVHQHFAKGACSANFVCLWRGHRCPACLVELVGSCGGDAMLEMTTSLGSYCVYLGGTVYLAIRLSKRGAFEVDKELYTASFDTLHSALKPEACDTWRRTRI